jgi:hypothetical protein
MPSEIHQRKLVEVIEELRAEGYRVIDTSMKRPDAIVLKDGKIVAVEVVLQHHRRQKGWKANGGVTLGSIRRKYSGFDDVIIRTCHAPILREKPTKPASAFKKAYNILHPV